MIFVAAITVPASTKQSAPQTTTIPIVPGSIKKVMIFFPPGCSGLAHLVLTWGLYQIFPSNQSASFGLGGVPIEWDDDTAIPAEPYELVATTWNDDSLYDHTITAHIVMAPATGAASPDQTAAQLLAESAAGTGT